WLRLTTAYADACIVFFGLEYGPPDFLDLAFLGVIEALRLYYTRRDDGMAHRKQDAQRLLEVLNKLPEQDREWVRGHIWEQPFPPFEIILEKLLNEHIELMNHLLLTDKWGFIREVMGTLIYTVRRDRDFHRLFNSGAELYWMGAKLRILLKACFL